VTNIPGRLYWNRGAYIPILKYRLGYYYVITVQSGKNPGIPPFFLRHRQIRDWTKAALDLVPGAG
jgi:hypothetical protein